MKSSSFLLAGAAFLASTAAGAQTRTIDTTTAANQFNFSCLGIAPGCGQNFGQTFTTPTGTPSLNSATFSLAASNASGLNYAFRVFAWTGTDITGPALYDSGSQSLTSTSFTSLTFSPNVVLTPGQEYMALFATAGLGNTTAQSAGQFVGDNVYSAGRFLWQRTDGDGIWNDFDLDATFSMTFGQPAVAAVPEPATWGMMILGFGAIGVGLRRRKAAVRTSVRFA